MKDGVREIESSELSNEEQTLTVVIPTGEFANNIRMWSNNNTICLGLLLLLLSFVHKTIADFLFYIYIF